MAKNPPAKFHGGQPDATPMPSKAASAEGGAAIPATGITPTDYRAGRGGMNATPMPAASRSPRSGVAPKSPIGVRPAASKMPPRR